MRSVGTEVKQVWRGEVLHFLGGGEGGGEGPKCAGREGGKGGKDFR